MHVYDDVDDVFGDDGGDDCLSERILIRRTVYGLEYFSNTHKARASCSSVTEQVRRYNGKRLLSAI